MHTRKNVPVSGVNVNLKRWETSLNPDPSKQVQDVIVPSKKNKLQEPANIFKNKIGKQIHSKRILGIILESRLKESTTREAIEN